MNAPRSLMRAWKPLFAVLLLAACDGPPASPTEPSQRSPFLAGTWRGTVAIQVNPGDPGAPPAASGPIMWTFEAVPQTNQQTFRTTIHSEHAWLPITTTGSTALTPDNTPPAQISTLGEYISPRGCRGTFGSVGTAQATRIDADFTGTDCNQATFTGQLLLTKN